MACECYDDGVMVVECEQCRENERCIAPLEIACAKHAEKSTGSIRFQRIATGTGTRFFIAYVTGTW